MYTFGVIIFGWSLISGITNHRQILSLLSEGRYFGGSFNFWNFTVIVNSETVGWLSTSFRY